MEKQTFKITIDAPREKVWDVLWSDDTYREWTSVFSPGSRAETDWRRTPIISHSMKLRLLDRRMSA